MRQKSISVRSRGFRIWQKLGFNPWKKPSVSRQKGSGDFYKGAFDAIPFLNDDAKRTFAHLLLRPGYMIRDYIRGDHERYLAPLTALIVFYAFFALVSSVLQPVQHKDGVLPNVSIDITPSEEDAPSVGENLTIDALHIIRRGYIYLHLDTHPEEVKTRGAAAIAALEGNLRSQGIPLFLGQFLLLWLAMSVSLRRFRIGVSAAAAASAYILCQFSFFMLFALLLTWGESKSIGLLIMLALLTVDLSQWLQIKWKSSLRLAIKTGVIYGIFFVLVLIAVSAMVVLIAWLRGQ